MREYQSSEKQNQFSLNSFRFNGLDQLDAGYRLLRYSGVLETDEDHERKVRFLANILSRDLKLPVEPIQVNGSRVLAVVASNEELTALRIPPEVPLTPDVAILTLDPAIQSLPFRDNGSIYSRLARRALLWAIEGALSEPTSDWWRYQRRFVRRRPSQDASVDHILAYPAFYVSVIPGRGGWFELLIDPSICHVDQRNLYQRYGDSIPTTINGKRYLYINGRDYYPITAVAITKTADRELMVDPRTGNSISIWQHLTNRWRGKGIAAIDNLSAKAPTVAYKTLTEQSRRAHSELLFELIGTSGSDYEESSPHADLIMGPSTRGNRTEYIVSAIEPYLKIFGKRLPAERAMRQLHQLEAENFKPPVLRFAGDQEVATNLATANRDRIAALRGIGPADSSPFADPQFFVHPASMPTAVWSDFSSRFALQVQDLCGQVLNANEVPFEKVYGLRSQARAMERAIGDRHGCGLVILPVMADRDRQTKLHHYLKRKYWKQFHTQCADQEKILSFYGHSTSKGRETWFVRNEDHSVYRSYLRNLAFGYLLVNRKWLWKLAHGSLRTQVHVGIDVFKGMAVFTFIYGDADLITFKTSQAVREEKLSCEQVREVLIENLGPDLAELNLQAESLTIHRDGRAFQSEVKGIRQALEELRDSYKLLASDYTLNIVELHKTSATRPRVYKTLKPGFDNPDVGFFAKLSEREGLIATTGYPMLRKGTARPLYFEVVEGETKISDIAHDIYALSHLAFSAPGSCLRLPFTIALADYILRETTPGDGKPLEEAEDAEFDTAFKTQKGGTS